ncbi:hypothetical protein ACYF6T_24260 [Streptomyces sp. 7R007]
MSTSDTALGESSHPVFPWFRRHRPGPRVGPLIGGALSGRIFHAAS